MFLIIRLIPSDPAVVLPGTTVGGPPLVEQLHGYGFDIARVDQAKPRSS